MTDAEIVDIEYARYEADNEYVEECRAKRLCPLCGHKFPERWMGHQPTHCPSCGQEPGRGFLR